jgi:hypothetical protein
MKAERVTPLTVTEMEVPPNVVPSGSDGAPANSAGPRSVPKTANIEPRAIPSPGSPTATKLAPLTTPPAGIVGTAEAVAANRRQASRAALQKFGMTKMLLGCFQASIIAGGQPASPLREEFMIGERSPGDKYYSAKPFANSTKR